LSAIGGVDFDIPGLSSVSDLLSKFPFNVADLLGKYRDFQSGYSGFNFNNPLDSLNGAFVKNVFDVVVLSFPELDIYSSTDVDGFPYDPLKGVKFNLEDYLPEIQVAFGFAVDVDSADPDFSLASLSVSFND